MTINPSEEATTLKDDLLRGLGQIAAYSGESERRVKHLIRAHGYPHFKVGRAVYSRRSWLDRYYAGGPGDAL